MRISRWIILIGVLSIVVGALGIITYSGLAYLNLSGTLPNDFDLIPGILNYQGFLYFSILVKGIYFIAGIFFLIKKPFSLKLMYAALVISFLYELIAMLMPSAELNISILLSPAFDLALLIGVYKISKYYFLSSEEIVDSQTISTKHMPNPQRLKILTFFGLIILSIPITIQGLWINAFYSADTHQKRVEIYHSYLPEFLQDPHTTSYLSLVSCLIVIILSGVNLSYSDKLWKLSNLIILIVSSLLLFLNLFQLM